MGDGTLRGSREGRGAVVGVGGCSGLGARRLLSSPRLYLSLVLGNVSVTLLSKQAK